MKKLLFTLFALFIFFYSAQAQCINGIKSYPLYKKGAQLVDKFDNSGSEIVRIEYDLIFTSKESFRTLYPDWTYTIIGFADGGVKNLDIKVYVYDDLLDKWTFVKQDITDEPDGIVTISPQEKANYKVEIIVKEFYEGYKAARYGLMYVH